MMRKTTPTTLAMTKMISAVVRSEPPSERVGATVSAKAKQDNTLLTQPI